MRYATRDDFPAIADLDGASFGFVYSAADVDDAMLELADARILVHEDADRVVGVTAGLPFTMTVPGGAGVPVVGVTWVSVEITHRRRGILRGLIERQLRDERDAGAVAAVLTASQGGIYERHGYGVAEQVTRFEIHRPAARLRAPVAAPAVRRLPAAAARAELPGIHDRWRRTTPGAVDRSDALWRFHFLDREFQREGASGLIHLVHADGYLSYRIVENWNDGLPRHTSRIVDYAPVTAAAHRALWQTLLSDELVGTIESIRVPVDDPLPLLLANPRHARPTIGRDGLWLRPLDVPRLLAARTYAVEVDVVLHVVDPLLGDVRCRLRGGPDGATCERVDAVPDLTLDVAALGAVSLGGTRLIALARADRVTGDPAVITRLDRAFLADRAPAHGTHF